MTKETLSASILQIYGKDRGADILLQLEKKPPSIPVTPTTPINQPVRLFSPPRPSVFTQFVYCSCYSPPSPLSLSRFLMALLHSSSPHIPYLPTFFFFSDIPYQSSVVSFPHFFLSPLSYLHSLFLHYRINSPLTLPVPLPLPLSVNSVPSTPS